MPTAQDRIGMSVIIDAEGSRGLRLLAFRARAAPSGRGIVPLPAQDAAERLAMRAAGASPRHRCSGAWRFSQAPWEAWSRAVSAAEAAVVRAERRLEDTRAAMVEAGQGFYLFKANTPGPGCGHPVCLGLPACAHPDVGSGGA